MPLSATSAAKICLGLVALTLIALPVSAAPAESLVASPTSLNWGHQSGQAAPSPREITISTSSGITPVPALSVAITGTNANLFEAQAGSGSVAVGVKPGVLAALETANTAKPYTATLTVSGTGFTPVDVPLTVTDTPAAPFSLGASSLTFTVGLGSGASSQALAINSNDNRQWTASASTANGGSWLSVSPSLGQGSGSVSVTVNPSAASLTYGTYSGTITVQPLGLNAVTASVSLTVGTTGSLSLSPGNMAFVYPKASVGGLPDAQQLQITSSVAATVSVTQGASSSWLKINGSTSWSDSFTAATSKTVNISVIPPDTSITASYTGSIVVSSSDGSVASVPVTMSVNSSSANVTLSAASVTLSSSTPSQAVTISTTSASAAFTVVSNTSWLSVNPGSGTAYASTPALLYLTANSTGMPAGIYYGSATVTAGGSSQNITVTFVVAGGGGGTIGSLVVAPTQLNFAMESGKSAPPSQQIAVAGTAGTAVSFTLSQTDWLKVESDSGSIPATLTVSVDAAKAPTAAGDYSGTVTVNGTTVTINLKVSATSVLIANPGSIVLTYDATSKTTTGGGLYQFIYVSSSSGTTPAITGTSNSNWLTVYQGSGQISVLITPTFLSVGASTGSITIASSSQSITVPVTVIVTGSGSGGGGGGDTGGNLIFSPTSLSFNTVTGSSPDTQGITVSTSAPATFTVTATSDSGSWLGVSPTTAIVSPGAPTGVTVSVDGTSLTAGTHTGTLTFNVNGATQSVHVTVTVTAPLVTMDVTNASPSFTYQIGGTVPAAQNLSVASSGAAIAYSVATSGGSWLSATPATGNTPGTVRVSVNPEGLAAGTYRGTVTVTSAGASNSPITRSVTLTVQESAVLVSSVSSLNYVYHNGGGAVPGAQTVSLTSSSNLALAFTATSNANWLSVTPANGTTPASVSIAVNPAGLAAGSYTGRVSVSSSSGAGSTVNVDVAFSVTAPLPTITRVVSSAAYKDGPLAGGEIVAIFGTFMGPDTPATQQLDDNGKVATTLSGVRVFVSGYPAPLTMVSATQAKAVVPYGIAARKSASVWVQYNGLRSNAMPVEVAPSAPGIMTVDESGTGQGIISNQDGSANSASNAAARGTTVTINITGEGQTNPAGVDGAIYTDAAHLPKAVLPVSVLIDGKTARVVDYGSTPNLVAGNSRVTVEVPQDAAVGVVPVVVQVGTATSQAGVTMAVK